MPIPTAFRADSRREDNAALRTEIATPGPISAAPLSEALARMLANMRRQVSAGRLLIMCGARRGLGARSIQLGFEFLETPPERLNARHAHTDSIHRADSSCA